MILYKKKAMRIIKIIISLCFVLGSLHSCSAQKELHRERCDVLQQLARSRTTISNNIVSEINIKSRGVIFNKDIYFNIDSLNLQYINGPMYRLNVEFGYVKNLWGLLTEEDLKFMERQFNDSNDMYMDYYKGFINSLNTRYENSKEYILYYDISLPLLSKDKQKCMFFRYDNFNTQSIPDVCIYKKDQGKWRLVALINGSIDD